MCIIIDTNMFGAYRDPKDSDMAPVRKWVNGRGKIVYVDAGKYGNELKSSNMLTLLGDYRDAGKANLADAEKVLAKTRELEQQNLKSDDPHIIALAQVSGTNLLVTGDDDLMHDFKNSKLIKQGKIYKNQSHTHLLTDRRCP